MTISAYGFSTYEEFLKLLKALPEEYRKTWIENIPKKRLFMESSTGTGSVAGFLIPDMYTPENIYDDALLSLKNNVGTPIARTLAGCGLLPERHMTPHVLALCDVNGITTAHMLARKGMLPKERVTEELLLLFDRDGWTVAGEDPKRPTRQTSCRSSAYHELALYGDIPDAFLTPRVLMCPNKKLKNGGSVAHLLAQQKKLPEWCLTPEILSISDKNGWTVAHVLAETGCLPEKFLTDSILWIAGNDGETVLATLAMTSRLPKKLAYSPDGKIAEELLFTAPFYWKTQSTIEILLEKGHFPPEQLTPDLAKRSVKTANSKRDRGIRTATLLSSFCQFLISMGQETGSVAGHIPGTDELVKMSPEQAVRYHLDHLPSGTLVMVLNALNKRSRLNEWGCSLIVKIHDILKHRDTIDIVEDIMENPGWDMSEACPELYEARGDRT